MTEIQQGNKCPQCQQELKEPRYRYLLMDLEEAAQKVKETFIKNCYALAHAETSIPLRITAYAKDFIESYPILERFDKCDVCHRDIKAIAKMENGNIVAKWIWWALAKRSKAEKKQNKGVQDVAF